MTKREKILLTVFISLLFAATFAVTVSSSLAKLQTANEGIAKYTSAMQSLPEAKMSDDVSQSVQKQNDGRQKTEISVTEIADIILVQLQTCGIKPRRYQISGTGTSQIVEFSFSCHVYDFSRFLYANAAADQFYAIKNLSVKPEQDRVSVVFRAAAVPSYIKQNVQRPEPSALVRLFTVRKPAAAVQADLKPQPEAAAAVPVLLKGDGIFKTVGFITGYDGISYLCIKNNETGRVYRLSPDEISENSDERYVFRIGEDSYFLSKKK